MRLLRYRSQLPAIECQFIEVVHYSWISNPHPAEKFYYLCDLSNPCGEQIY